MISVSERCWLLLSVSGEHSWLGRATDPSPTEILAAEDALRRMGTSGYLAVSAGDYWGPGELSVLRVQDLAGAEEASFPSAVNAFLARRKKARSGG